jgi:antitoxin component YwqK of YwqJK toxin-antitoxin module
MAHQARLLSKLFLLILCFSACNTAVSPSEPLLITSINGRFENKNGVLYLENALYSGTVFMLHPRSMDTAELRSYLQGKEHGTWKKFYEKGLLHEQREFSEGKKVGNYKAWWPNGKLQLHYVFEDDEYNGTCREWNQQGLLVKEMNYRSGHEEGSQKLFYDNGKVRANYTMTNGRRFGLLGTKNCVNVSDSIFKD